MPRHRYRGDRQQAVTTHKTVRPSGIQEWGELNTSFSIHENIWDEPGRRYLNGPDTPDRRKAARRIPKPVTHEKVLTTPVREPSCTSSDGYLSVTNGLFDMPPERYLSVFPDGRTYSGVFAAQAAAHFNDVFHEETSLPNFLFELSEVKHLLTSLYRVIREPKNLRGNFLLYSFGIKPLIQDLISFWTLMSVLKKRLQYLKRNNGRPIRERFAYTPNVPIGAETLYGNPANDYRVLYMKVEKYQCRMRVSADVVRVVEGLDEPLSLLTAALESLGFFNPVKVMWNVIPFSFVIDWFLKIDSYLDLLKRPTFQQSVRFSNTCWSIDEMGVVLATADFPAAGPRFVTAGRARIERYRRFIGFPPLTIDGGLSSPGVLQRVLLALLLSPHSEARTFFFK